MRRLLPCGCAGLLLLSACAARSPLAPEDVLRKAALASSTLQSAAFTLHADLKLPSPTGTTAVSLAAKGVLQDGGRTAQFTAQATGSLPFQDGMHLFSGIGDVVAEWGRETYFRLQAVNADPPTPVLPADALRQALGVWWRVPSGDPATPVGPDPRILNAQADVVKVTRDRGVQRIHGRSAYHYDVTLDPEKLIAFLQRIAEQDGKPFDRTKTLQDFQGYDATGELWVDAVSFYTHQITWDIRPKDPARGATITLSAELTDHDAAPAVHAPVQFKTYPPGRFLETALSGTGIVLRASGSLLPTAEEEPSILDVFGEPAASGTGAESLQPLLPTE